MGLKHAISGLRVIWSSRVRTLRRILFHTMMLISKTPARHMIVRMVPYEPISVRRARPRGFCSQSSVKGERDAKQLGHGMETMPLHAVPRALGGQFRAR